MYIYIYIYISLSFCIYLLLCFLFNFLRYHIMDVMFSAGLTKPLDAHFRVMPRYFVDYCKVTLFGYCHVNFRLLPCYFVGFVTILFDFVLAIATLLVSFLFFCFSFYDSPLFLLLRWGHVTHMVIAMQLFVFLGLSCCFCWFGQVG